jgi:hypothetical protein
MEEKITKSGVELIAEERQRQIDQEGWTEEHDDQWQGGEMAKAAMAYTYSRYISSKDVLVLYWPWDKKFWKPKDPIRDLVRAGALIAAEIDRLQRGGG